jgi:olefin beta-lactone synthetase
LPSWQDAAVNFASLVLRHVADRPDRAALVLPTRWDEEGVHEERTVTYADLGAAIARFRGGLREGGFEAGDRIVVLFPVGLDLYALVLAAMAEGVAVVLVDGGMGSKKILQAIRTSGAKALVSVMALLKYRWVAPALWGRRWYAVDGPAFRVRPIDALRGEPIVEPARDCASNDHALITFTSGSTGRPKGADRTHGLLSAQHHALAEHFPHADDEIDLPAFPVVVLHDLCCGVTAVVPPVDFAAVATVNRDVVLTHARKHRVTRLSGAPAYVDALVSADLDLPTLRQLGVGGARVSRGLAAKIRSATAAEGLILYGSTEAEPIASVPVDEMLQAEGAGVLVGRPAAAATVRLISLPHGADTVGGVDAFAVPRGAVGELVVRGDHVNRGYVDDPEATAANKLFPADGSCWHRTGDLGWFDSQGRIWLVGRVSDVVTVDGRDLHPFLIEEQVERRAGVVRCALISGEGVPPTLVVEGSVEGLTIPGVDVVQLDRIPVDGRHNSKIDRVRLREMLRGR